MKQYEVAIQKGTQLCARFAYKPNSLKYCGQPSAVAKLTNCIQKGDCEGVSFEISKFKALHSYLKLISDKVGLPLLHYDVCEAYWIGNQLLDQFDRDDFKVLLELFINQGVPDFFTSELEKKFVESDVPFLPHHAFNVFFVGVGQVTSSVRYSIENINNCLIRSGVVTKITKKNMTIKTEVIMPTFTFREIEEVCDIGFVQDVDIGDTVAVHWGAASMKLNKNQQTSLQNTNKKLLQSLAPFLPKE